MQKKYKTLCGAAEKVMTLRGTAGGYAEILRDVHLQATTEKASNITWHTPRNVTAAARARCRARSFDRTQEQRAEEQLL
jgi:hypothetical protein